MAHKMPARGNDPDDACVRRALEELIAGLGTKEERPSDDLVAAMRSRDIPTCIHKMAAWFGLPIAVSVSWVPRQFSRTTTIRFETDSLVPTDPTGREAAGITAQVLIPASLPPLGTLGLQGFPIEVRVSENCYQHPLTFVTLMAHELSHVLLAALRHPSQDSELHTDLIPLVLGFGRMVQQGRRTVETGLQGIETTTCTTTYGYLTDAQFSFACSRVADARERCRGQKDRLLQTVLRLHGQLERVLRDLSTLGGYLQHLDARRPARVKEEHLARLMELHAPDYAFGWKSRTRKCGARVEAATVFAKNLDHYTPHAMTDLGRHAQAMAEVSAELSDIGAAIAADLRILRNYATLGYRLQKVLQ